MDRTLTNISIVILSAIFLIAVHKIAFIGLALKWLTSLGVWLIVFREAFIKYDYYDFNFIDFMFRIIVMVAWTIVVYLFVVYGIGGEDSQWDYV